MGFQNLASDPGLEPWRNGMTDTYLQNLVVISNDALVLSPMALYQDIGLQNLGSIPSGTSKG